MTKQHRIIDFVDYKAYLLHVEAHSQPKRGLRTRWAQACGCQSAYVSQVLNGSAHFSLEQILSIGEQSLELTGQELEYLLLQVEWARAGSPSLRKHFRKKLDQAREEGLDLKNRVSSPSELSLESQQQYYSYWFHSAIHIAVTVPGLQDSISISNTLKLPLEVVRESLEFLESIALVKRAGNLYVPGESTLHLSRQSSLLKRHHLNWRVQAVSLLERTRETNLHYTTVSSLSRDDFERIRTRLVEEISTYTAIVKPSKEEVLAAFSVDFIKLST